MPRAKFEPMIPVTKRPRHALDRAATETGFIHISLMFIFNVGLDFSQKHKFFSRLWNFRGLLNVTYLRASGGQSPSPREEVPLQNWF
jgi:hypothetical protein